MRFASHRDIARALERSLRRARVPVAFSAGFSPHPKISYAGAAPTGVASEAEYLELTLTEPREPELVRVQLNEAMPTGIDIVEIVMASAGGLADRLEASEWRVVLPGVAPDDAAAAAAAVLAADTIEVERLTKKGRRRFDVRSSLVAMEPADGRASTEPSQTYATLRMVVRHTTPAVRPDDVVTGLQQVADLAPPSPPMVTRLAQGPLDETSGGLADPFDPDRGPARDAESDRGTAGSEAADAVSVESATGAPTSSKPMRKAAP